MKREFIFFSLLILCFGQPWKNGRLWGTNIHFTKGLPGEVNQLTSAFNVVRMDFTWSSIETQKGIYSFSNYDYLYESLKDTGKPVTPYWILDYGNPLYNNGLPPTTPDSIQAFVNFVEISIEHFKDKGIIWEMWNEPNGGFWKPSPNATAYSILAVAVGKAIRSNPNIQKEIYVGPALSTVDLTYAKTTFEGGVLEYFDAVSVHPYRGGGPESVLTDYDNLRTLINQYAPKGKNIPILSGEWGWSTCVAPCSPGVASIIDIETQAKYLSRQWLINALVDVPVSVFYDYKNDGPDPTEREQNFGTVYNAYENNTNVPHKPKPSYNAALTLQEHLVNLPFKSRIQSSNKDPQTYILAFENDVYAAWKLSGTPLACDPQQRVDCGFSGISKQQCESKGCCFIDPYVPPGPQCYYHPVNTTGSVTFTALNSGCFQVIDMVGNVVNSNLCTSNDATITVTISDSPSYLKKK